ncbi:MAG: hypothetical protein KKF46_01735 [Nanoarchaeota archaeon]|nr:hypothetical protein [Nanoarchaeota archaeon]MBU1321053.1 hypothetical protein [Nanoarchaeota archaeon]MBU1598122.1 hypothetical protein [Nanoarchaeota archaeon]MBU2442314.1 hypothetical protein [Nanoarchaeota archaeon]
MLEQKKKKDNRTTGDKGADLPDANKPVIVRVKPGTAAEKSLRFLLPDHMADMSIDKIVSHALELGEEDGFTREQLRYQDKIRIEMKDKYGISVNGQAIKGTEKITDYLRDATSTAGREYLEAEIIVAARQEGAKKSIDYMLR